MRILLICNSEHWGGAERYVTALARGFLARQHEVWVAAQPHSPLHSAASRSTGLYIHDLDLGPKLSRRSRMEFVRNALSYRAKLQDFLRQAASEHAIDIAHFQFKKEQILGTRLATSCGLKVVWTEHDQLPRALSRSTVGKRIYVRASRSVSRILTVADFVKNDLLQHGLPASRIRVCHNGIEVTTSSNGEEQARTRHDFSYSDEDVVIGTISRLAWTKGVGQLIAAAPQIIASIPHVQFLIVGDGPERAQLEERTKLEGLSRRFTFAGHRTDVPRLLTALDVFVSPSFTEGLPYALLEAMAEGLPVVASSVGGVPEVVLHGTTGFLVNPGRPDELARAIISLARDEHMRKSFGLAAQNRIQVSFSFNSMLDCTESAFLEAYREAGDGAR